MYCISKLLGLIISQSKIAGFQHEVKVRIKSAIPVGYVLKG